MLDDQYHMIEFDRVKTMEWLQNWLKHKMVVQALNHLRARTGLEPVIKQDNGIFLHEVVAVMFASTQGTPEAYVDLLLEFGRFNVLEGEDRNG